MAFTHKAFTLLPSPLSSFHFRNVPFMDFCHDRSRRKARPRGDQVCLGNNDQPFSSSSEDSQEELSLNDHRRNLKLSAKRCFLPICFWRPNKCRGEFPSMARRRPTSDLVEVVTTWKGQKEEALGSSTGRWPRHGLSHFLRDGDNGVGSSERQFCEWSALNSPVIGVTLIYKESPGGLWNIRCTQCKFPHSCSLCSR